MFTNSNNKFSLRKAVLVGCVAWILSPSTSFATSTVDISIGMKMLLLMQERYNSTIPIAIVYNPAIPASISDANNIKKNIDSGAGIPEELTVNAYLVSSDQMDRIAGAKIAFLADHLSSDGVNSVCDKAGQQGILTISGDINCVKANKCVLGIVTKPRVEIYYSSEAAKASHVTFNSAFIMLAKKI